MLTNPLPQNKNMNSRTMDPGGAFGRIPNPAGIASHHGCINMVNAMNVVTHSKYYCLSQPNLGKEPAPPESPLCIEKPNEDPEALPRISKGVLKCSRNNTNSRATHNYSIIEDLGQTPCAMSALEVL